MTKTVSARIDNSVHNNLVERCNKLGCNINEFVGESVKLMLTNSTDFEFEPEESEIKIDPKPQVIIKPIPEKLASKVNNVHIVEI